jgi:hypothetical protein
LPRKGARQHQRCFRRIALATLDFERHRGLVTVVDDVPADLPNTIPSVWEVTHPTLPSFAFMDAIRVPGT